MAVKQDVECKIIIKVLSGISSTGQNTYTQRTFSNINPELTDDDVLDIGTKLAGLQSHDLGSVYREDSAQIVEA